MNAYVCFGCKMTLTRSSIVSYSKDYVRHPDGTKEIISRQWCIGCSNGTYSSPKCDFCPNGYAVSVVTSTIAPKTEKWVCHIYAHIMLTRGSL